VRLKKFERKAFKSFPFLWSLSLFAPRISQDSCHATSPTGSALESGADWSGACAGFSGTWILSSDWLSYGMRKFLLTTAILVAAAFPHMTSAQGCDGAGNCYVRAAATGAGTGADWTNAYTGFGSSAGLVNPASMTRGVTYYVAGGNYSIGSVITWNTPDAGTTPITIQAPTIAIHGTSTGWSNSYQAQAVWSSWYVESDYWTFNGVYRGSGAGLPATDWRTGYGFKINNNNGANANIGGSGIWLGPTSGTGSNVTVEYVEIAGSGDTTGTYGDRGITDNYGQNPVIQFNYVHDTGNCSLVFDAVGKVFAEYNWLMNDQSTPEVHAEGIALRGPMTVTIAYNYLENEEGTGYIGTPCPSDGCNNGRGTWSFYGNVFFANPSEWHGNTSPQNGLSYAFIQFFAGSWTALTFYNNTIYQISGSSPMGACQAVNGGSVTGTAFTAQNNLFGNCSTSGTPGPGGLTSLTYTNNTYCSVASAGDSGTGIQNLASCSLFSSPSTNNFALASDTSAWAALSSPYNVDLLGDTRTSSRGAFQMGGVAANVPAPPTSLIATVQQ